MYVRQGKHFLREEASSQKQEEEQRADTNWHECHEFKRFFRVRATNPQAGCLWYFKGKG